MTAGDTAVAKAARVSRTFARILFYQVDDDRLTRNEILDIFAGWRKRDDAWDTRLADLSIMVSADPSGWLDAMLAPAAREGDDDAARHALHLAIRSSEDPGATEADLAARARTDPELAELIAGALRGGWDYIDAEHALDVLGEDFVFDAWSKLQENWRLEDRDDQRADVMLDFWAEDLMQTMITFNIDRAFDLLLAYLRWQEDGSLRRQAGIAWLESINFAAAPDFIDRIEDQARRNPRLRDAMRAMYPPRNSSEIERRFVAASREPEVSSTE